MLKAFFKLYKKWSNKICILLQLFADSWLQIVAIRFIESLIKVYYFQHDWGTRTKNGFFKISKNDLPMLLEIHRKPWIPIRNAAGALQISISSEMLPVVFPNSSSKIPSWFVMKCGELKIRNILEEDWYWVNPTLPTRNTRAPGSSQCPRPSSNEPRASRWGRPTASLWSDVWSDFRSPGLRIMIWVELKI